MGRINFSAISSVILIFNLIDYGSSSLVAENVLGGEKALPGTYRHVCALYLDGKVHCTCAILDDRWVVTAAHCVTASKPTGGWEIYIGNWKVVAGVYDLRKARRTGVSSRVTKISVPKKHKMNKAYHDFAILELKTSLNVAGNDLKALSVPPKDTDLYTKYLNTMVSVAGFGWDHVVTKFDSRTNKKYTEGKHRSRVLNHIKVLLFQDPNVCCNRDTVICTKIEWQEKADAKALCKGDSGGVIEKEGFALAVLSRGPVFDRAKKYQIIKFTKLAPHHDMIDDIMHYRPNQQVDTKWTLNFADKSEHELSDISEQSESESSDSRQKRSKGSIKFTRPKPPKTKIDRSKTSFTTPLTRPTQSTTFAKPSSTTPSTSFTKPSATTPSTTSAKPSSTTQSTTSIKPSSTTQSTTSTQPSSTTQLQLYSSTTSKSTTSVSSTKDGGPEKSTTSKSTTKSVSTTAVASTTKTVSRSNFGKNSCRPRTWSMC